MERKNRNKNQEDNDEGGSGIGLFGGILIGVGALIAGVVGKTIYDEVVKEEEEETAKEKDKEEKEINTFYNQQKTTDDELNSTLDSFICPITQEIMNDPVITPSGISYEKEAIVNWLKKNDTDPITKKLLDKNSLIPNFALKNAINDYRQSQSQIHQSNISSKK